MLEAAKSYLRTLSNAEFLAVSCNLSKLHDGIIRVVHNQSLSLHLVPSFTLFPFTLFLQPKGTTHPYTHLVPFYLYFHTKGNNLYPHLPCSLLPYFSNQKEQPISPLTLFPFTYIPTQKRNNLLHISKFVRTFAPDFSLFPFSANNRTEGTTHP